MLTAPEVARLLGLKPRTVYALGLPCYRFGRAVRFDPADVEAYRDPRYGVTVRLISRTARASCAVPVYRGKPPRITRLRCPECPVLGGFPRTV